MYAEKIRIAVIKRKMTLSQLATAIGSTQSNFANKLYRDNFSEKDLIKICTALNCTLDSKFVFNDTKEEI